jgi:hypothetical protein
MLNGVRVGMALGFLALLLSRAAGQSIDSQFTSSPSEPQKADPSAGTAVYQTPAGTFDADGSIAPRLTVTHVTGPGVGYREGFTTVQGMIPIAQKAGDSLWFADIRGIIADNDPLAANAGAGYRIYSSDWERVFGVNAYYDYRDTGQRSFHQIAGGVETLGCCWDARANWYVPIGPDRRQLFNVPLQTETTCFDPHYGGYNLLFNEVINQTRLRELQAAMTGFDLEVGTPVPYTRDLLKAYLGTYYYSVSGIPDAWGVRGRLEANYNDRVILSLAVQNDRVFNTTVVFAAGISFGGLCGHRHCPCVASERLADLVQRNYEIVVTKEDFVDHVTTRQSNVAAIDPSTGKPIIIVHADSNAAPGGNGTFEHPFNTLLALQNGSQPGDILLVHASSVFDGGVNPADRGIVLKDNQRFLGDAPNCPHTVNTLQCGIITLPRTVTSGGAAPIIDFVPPNGTPPTGPNAVTLANNNEVSGFNIMPSGPNSAFAHAVAGTGITSFNINCNTIGFSDEDNGASSIFLQNVRGTGVITMNTFHAESNSGAPNRDAIHIEYTGAAPTAALNVSITDNKFLNQGPVNFEAFDSAISINTVMSTHVTALISGNNLDVSAATRGPASFAGIDLRTNDSSQVFATIIGNNISGLAANRATGINLAANDTSRLTAIITGNKIDNNTGSGINMPQNGDYPGQFNNLTGAVATRISGNNISGNGSDGITMDTFGTLNIGITHNTFTGNTGFGANITSDGTVCLRLTGNSSTTGYSVTNDAMDTFKLENWPGPNFGNTGTVTQSGIITLVAPNSCPVP